MRNEAVAAVAGFALVAGGVGGWLIADDGGSDESSAGRDLDVSLTDVETTADFQYRFPTWWTDGTTALRLAPSDAGMDLEDPLTPRREITDPSISARIGSDIPIEPLAIGALPGANGGPWVALGVPYDVSPADDAAVLRVRAWTGPQQTENGVFDAAPPAELPVDTTAQRIGGAEPQTDVALAELDGKVVALTTVSQREAYLEGGETKHRTLRSGALRCDDLTACRWQPAALPDGGLTLGLGSTGNGFVMITERGLPNENDTERGLPNENDTERGLPNENDTERGLPNENDTERGLPNENDTESGEDAGIWFADDADLTWRQIGTAPAGARLRLTQDGAGAALLVWTTRDQDDRTLAIAAVTAEGTIEEAVPAASISEYDRVTSVVRVGDNGWLLGGGSNAGADDVDLRYDARSPLLLRLDDDRWTAVNHPLLAAQPDQTVEALTAPSGRGSDGSDEPAIEMATSSAVQRIDMLWGIDPD